MKRLLLALILVLTLTVPFCPASLGESEREVVTFHVSGILSSKWNDYPDNALAQYLKERFGVQFEVIDMGDRKDAMMASGDLPDMFIIEANEIAPLISAQFLCPLDDLLAEYGPDIYPTEDILQFARDSIGDGERVYGILARYIEDCGQWTHQWGLNVDWARYKELGCPEVQASVDDIYQVMKKMVELKPTTDDGLPVYATAYPTIEMRGRSLYASSPLGYYSANNFAAINCNTGELELLYTNPDSFLWQFEHMYWQLNQDGLLDPDSFMMDYDANSLKAVNGQYVATLYHDITMNYTNLMAEEGKAAGFQYIPIEGSCAWTGADFTYGARNVRCISAKCEHPERLIEVWNWLSTPEGGRIAGSGFENETWKYVDGVPTLTPEAIEAYQTRNEYYYTSGMGFEWNSAYNGVTNDGHKANLFEDSTYRLQNLTAMELDVQKTYGKIMDDIVHEMIDEGKMCTQGTPNMRVINALSILPDDMQRILNEVDAILNEGMVQCVMAPTEEEFYATRDALIAQITDMGMEQVNDWFKSNYDELMKKYS